MLIFGAIPPPIGGIATLLSLILNSELRNKYHISAFDPSKAAPKGKNLATKILLKVVSLLRYGVTLKHKKPQLVHIHTSAYTGFWINSFYLVATKLFRKKIVLHIHRGDFHVFYQRNDILRRWLIRRILGLCDKLIILSEKWRPFFASIITPHKIEVLPNGVRPDEYNGNNLRCEKQIDLDQKKLVLFAGTLCHEKGVYDIVKAIPMIRNKVRDVMFLFAGEPKSLEDSKRLDYLCQHGVKENYIRFLGNVTGREKIDLFLSSDIFVLPSYSEGFPFTIIEAMAAGLPVVSTDVGAIPEIVVDGEGGFIINRGDYEKMAENINILLLDKELCSEFGKNNRKKVFEQYNLDRLISKLDRIYSQLL